jgi:CRP-like cAMP-binding protein
MVKTDASAVGSGPVRRGQIFNNQFSPDAKKDLTVHAKTDKSKEFLLGALTSHYLFESLGAEDMERIVECMKPLVVSAGETVIRQGDVGDLFYCLEQGGANAMVDGAVVFSYASGGCFGELALIYNAPRAASVIATLACSFWALDLGTFRQILASTSSSKLVKRCEFLKKCVFLDPLSPEQIAKLAGALDVVTYADGQYIIKQGDVGDSFYIIESGSVKCTQIKSNGREVELINLHAGDYFGEMALMLNETRHANCVAVDEVSCFTLDRAKFNMLLGSVQDLLARRMRIRILQSVPLLSKLSETKLARLSGVMRVQSFTAGSYIIKQGEEGSRFYIINEGEVRCTRQVSAHQEEELIKLYPQEFFGERALLTNEPRKANVIAVGNVECLVLERSNFQSLLTEVHDDIKDVVSKRAPEEEEVVAGPTTDFRFEDLTVMRTIGTGTFGRVKVVQHKVSGRVCALKCMKKTEIVASHQEKNIMNEKNLLFECSTCPFILGLLQTYNQPNQIMMLMEFIQGGELWTYIYEKTNMVKRNAAGGFEMSAVKFYAANVLLAFRHMHKKGMAYRYTH